VCWFVFVLVPSTPRSKSFLQTVSFFAFSSTPCCSAPAFWANSPHLPPSKISFYGQTLFRQEVNGWLAGDSQLCFFSIPLPWISAGTCFTGFLQTAGPIFPSLRLIFLSAANFLWLPTLVHYFLNHAFSFTFLTPWLTPTFPPLERHRIFTRPLFAPRRTFVITMTMITTGGKRYHQRCFRHDRLFMICTKSHWVSFIFIHSWFLKSVFRPVCVRKVFSVMGDDLP